MYLREKNTRKKIIFENNGCQVVPEKISIDGGQKVNSIILFDSIGSIVLFFILYDDHATKNYVHIKRSNGTSSEFDNASRI